MQSPNTVLFWHYCGFAFVSGLTDNNDFNNLLQMLLLNQYEENQRRFVLFINDKKWNDTVKKILTNNMKIKIAERLRFRFNYKLFQSINKPVPNGYELRDTDKTLIEKLECHVIPSYSWHSTEAFLTGGKGYCLMDCDRIACNTISSAIGNNTIDIGIETMPNYRMKGLAVPTAYRMIKYCLENGYEPNWGCFSANIGSSHIAESLGFEVLDSHLMYISK